MALKFVLFLALVAISLARPDAPLPSYGYQAAPAPRAYQPAPKAYQAEQYAPAKYDFDWAVRDDLSANNFGQQESRDGDNTQGSYYVLLPDGRTQKVIYSVNGDSGFIADVTYEGEARYEQPQPYKPPQAQAYRPPQPPAYAPPQPSNRY